MGHFTQPTPPGATCDPARHEQPLLVATIPEAHASHACVNGLYHVLFWHVPHAADWLPSARIVTPAHLQSLKLELPLPAVRKLNGQGVHCASTERSGLNTICGLLEYVFCGHATQDVTVPLPEMTAYVPRGHALGLRVQNSRLSRQFCSHPDAQ